VGTISAIYKIVVKQGMNAGLAKVTRKNREKGIHNERVNQRENLVRKQKEKYQRFKKNREIWSAIAMSMDAQCS
jgi:hypothetical protein